MTSLIGASKNGHVEIVKLLLEQEGIDINAESNDGETAIIAAYSNGKNEIVEILKNQNGIIFNENLLDKPRKPSSFGKISALADASKVRSWGTNSSTSYGSTGWSQSNAKTSWGTNSSTNYGSTGWSQSNAKKSWGK